MAGKKKSQDKSTAKNDMRSRAEKILQEISGKEPIAAGADLGQALHELQVHQIELEMQNDELRRAETELVTAHRKYADLYDLAPVGYFVLDSGGVIVEVNLTGAAMLGIERKWLTGKPFNVFVCKESQNEFHMHRRKVLQEGGMAACELTMTRQDGAMLYASVSTYGEQKGLGKGRRCMMTVTDITVRRKAEEALRQSQGQLRQHTEVLDMRVSERTAELAHSVEALREEVDRRKVAEVFLRKQAVQLRELAGELALAEQRERRRLAHVLHDNLQQLLTAARFRLAPLRREEGTAVSSAAVDVDELISQSIEISRTLTGELSPPVLHEQGLGAAMDWLKQWMMDKHGLSIEVSTGEHLDGIEEDITSIMFQAIRELLFNIVKHAGVRSARVSVERQGDRIRAVISDEGSGFDQAVAAGGSKQGGGFGLFSIKERLGVMGGSLVVESSPGRGSRFTLTSPPLENSK